MMSLICDKGKCSSTVNVNNYWYAEWLWYYKNPVTHMWVMEKNTKTGSVSGVYFRLHPLFFRVLSIKAI